MKRSTVYVTSMPTRPRRGWIAVAIVVGVGLTLGACPSGSEDSDDEGVEDLTIVVEADKSRILEEEKRLQEKRKDVQAEAATLESQRQALKKQLSSLSKKDKKARAQLEAEEKRLANEERRMRQRLKSFESERAKLDGEKSRLLERISALAGTKGDIGGAVKADVQRLTRNVNQLQKDIDRLNTDSAKRHDETMALLREIARGGGTRTVMVSAPAKASGPNITKRQVEKVRSQAKNKMRIKGILPADLPPAARDFEKSGSTALSSKNYTSAHESYSQLAAIIDGIRIDQAFVQAKMTRINRSYNEKVAKLDSNKHARLQKFLDDVSDSFSDGRYDRANKKINQIYALLSGR
ncbi:MAG: hypothetical protein V3T05_13660 [Myxococcota bacterium]